jgi:VanZ family protein
MMLGIKRRYYIVTLCLYLGAVLALCLIRPEGLPQVSPSFLGIPIDKVAHFLMFLPFVLLAYASLIKPDIPAGRKAAVLAILTFAGTGLAAGTEYMQSLTEYRSCDINDLYADIMGVLAGTALTPWLDKYKKNYSTK